MSGTSSSQLQKPVKELNGFSLYYVGDIAVIVIDRGENRLNPVFVQTMMELLDDVEKNESCKGLITTGVGKFYGNGLDLKHLVELDTYALQKFWKGFMVLMKRVVLYPLPTLCAMNGHCFAGGALFAFCHDLRTMRKDKCWLSFNEVFINRTFARNHYPLLRVKMGSGRNYTDALVLGKRFTAQEAFNNGLVSGIPSQALLLAESIRTLKAFSGKSGYVRESLVAMKADVYKDYVEAVDAEMEAQDVQKGADIVHAKL